MVAWLKKGYADEQKVNKRFMWKEIERKPSSGMEEYLQANGEEPSRTKAKHSVYCTHNALVTPLLFEKF